MGHFFSKVSLFIDKKEAAAHLILDQDFATAPSSYYFSFLIIDLIPNINCIVSLATNNSNANTSHMNWVKCV